MDTIAAIATARQPSAIGIVRLSGEGTLEVLSKLFRAESGQGAEGLRPRKLTYGAILDPEGAVLDYGLAVLFPEGHSYTGELSAELHCHGSPVVLESVLRAAFHAGARQAQPGEYTRRAFLNGKMDLTQAEAVIDLIDAETEEMARNAISQLSGSLLRRVDGVYASLLELSSHCYAAVDYPEEDLAPPDREEFRWVLEEARGELQALLDTAARGRILKSGVLTAIIGAPNAGKSSLLNFLLGYPRAIVTDVAGTTRDTIEEKVLVGGVLLRLVDTAGLRESRDLIESLGVERSREALERSDLVLVLSERGQAPGEETLTALRLAQKSGKPWILLESKCDLWDHSVSLPLSGQNPPRGRIPFSSVSGAGLETLEHTLQSLFPSLPPSQGAVLTNARQTGAVERALQSVDSALEALEAGLPEDILLTEIEQGMNAVGELTGRTAREDIVTQIFARFCVGK